MEASLLISSKSLYCRPMVYENEEQDKQWRALIVKAQSGDSAAYRELLSALVPVIRRAVVKSLPSPDSADDVVQEVLLSVHKALHTYDSNRPFTPWLMAIVSFRKTDFLRQHYAARGNKQVSLESVDIPDYLNSSDSSMNCHDIENAINELPKKQRKVVELLKIKGFSTKEVSEQTGLSETAVKVTMHRALQKLKEKLA
jgi:RNA polymerase sigma-70 factor (ECF subfamily)